MSQRQASPHTVAAYRNTFRLLLRFAWQHTGKHPARLALADLDAPRLGAFLQHLETDRGNSVTTRNARLAAIHSLFRYAALRAPEHAALIQRVLAIPAKRTDRTIVCYLTRPEIERPAGRPRPHHLARPPRPRPAPDRRQTGLRVSELTGLSCQDVASRPRRTRALPRQRPQRTLHPADRQHHQDPAQMARRTCWPARRPAVPHPPRPPLSRDAVERLVARHTAEAALACPTLTAKKISPHVLRHTAAMALLHAGTDTSVIALWLGHFSGVPGLSQVASF